LACNSYAFRFISEVSEIARSVTARRRLWGGAPSLSEIGQPAVPAAPANVS
jgi:hypothetical protein